MIGIFASSRDDDINPLQLGVVQITLSRMESTMKNYREKFEETKHSGEYLFCDPPPPLFHFCANLE